MRAALLQLSHCAVFTIRAAAARLYTAARSYSSARSKTARTTVSGGSSRRKPLWI